MSNTQTARGRKEWMPNRMFDPVSNPFAIQNLLEKKVETFVEQRDERAEAVFTFDAVVMANPVHAFSEQTIEDPAAAEPQGFQADWMDAGHDFAGDEQTATGDFVAGSAQAPAAFSADTQAHKADDAGEHAPSDSQATATEPAIAAAHADANANAEAVTAAVAEAAAQPADAGRADASAEQQTGDVTPSAPSAEAAAAGANTDTGSQAGEDGQPDVLAASVAAEEAAAAEAIAMAEAAEAVSQAEQAAPAEAAAEAAQEAAASAADAAEPAPAPATPPATAPSGISEDELQSRLDAAREEGRTEVRAELERVRTEAHEQGREEGDAAGYARAKDELGKEYEDKIAQMQSMIDALQALSYNPDAMFEPMKTLSVHIAEQLVRGELTQSPQAISRLVDNCLRELNASGEKAVIIHLHPEDVEQYKPQAAQFGDALVLRADPKLERGSVRASLEGSVVEDLIQRRVAGLKKGLMQAPAPSWRANAGRLSDRIADGQRGSRQVEDVTIAAARKDADAKVDTPAGTDSVTEATAASADNTDA